MKIALIGYGKMGHEIERIALGAGQRKNEIALIVDPNSAGAKTIAEADFNGAKIDVAIEFSHPEAVLQNIDALLKRKIPIVVGTTGWYDHLKEVEQKVNEAQGTLLWASNFSIGVHLFWKMVERGAQLMNRFDEYDIFGNEFHHNQKADSPSGTAKTTAEILMKNIDRKTTLVTQEMMRKIEPHELHFSSTRGGSIPGTHSVYFDSPADTIEITHTARSRNGFAMGAIRSAEWLTSQYRAGKRGFFSIEDYLKDIIPH